VNAAQKRDPDDGTGQRRPDVSGLSALEDTLRQALASVPRDQVVTFIVRALPAEVLVDENARLHGGKVRKVSVSMPEELTEAVRARTGVGGFSRYVTDAVQQRIRHDLLGDLVAGFEAAYGPIPEELVEKAMREWPDYEDK
jgi:hypothetical protein